VVDWPPGSYTEDGQGERDGHDMRPINAVVNACHHRTLVLMARIAAVLGRDEDARAFAARAARVHDSFNAVFFDAARGVYVDGEGSTHASQHSNLFALAFGLVPDERVAAVRDFVVARGMACSVYAAQYLLEALYEHDAEAEALALMTAQHDRSWWNMIAQGSTITWEAWDHRYKTNLDWNHAWGAAPANIIPRYLMGIRPLTPGWGRVLIQPRPADLGHAAIRHPTPRGAVELVIDQQGGGGGLRAELTLPASMRARVEIPAGPDAALSLGGAPIAAERRGRFLRIELAAGAHVIERRGA